MRALFLLALCVAAVGCAAYHERDVQPALDARCVAASAAGASAADVPDTEAPARLPAPTGGVCDGSGGLRLVVATQYGASGPDYFGFAYEFGGEFLVIDGSCHFYAQSDYRRGVVEGQLTPERILEIMRSIALSDAPDQVATPSGCSTRDYDRLIATPTHSLRCRCDACATSSAATAAMQQAASWIRLLAESGTPSAGPVRASARPNGPADQAVAQQDPPPSAWPLVRTLQSVPGLIATDWSTAHGARFAGADATALRALRSAMSAASPSLIHVQDCAQSYGLLIRDELPSAVAQELRAFLPTAWSRPQAPSCVSARVAVTPDEACLQF
jgi:hypothetical protein